ncbi:transcriptional regulator, PaaX family [Cryobacterium psychrotolerans]|uniref:Transcriptional regulator, PaaX family n=1 Tax=Cryobacterium psychrotolerans TaxID=386301 RepID=A0A1G9B8T5_9MICO|nr:PaaX family transcriptional regulator C-terminal domain-containing protein [Cryobacterium psychrotolerans]TFD84671.1 PaaX family transcriptional regulator [Cryobacterium psychrotolerans]SDK35879.1 transcriptional regulator, PaaX family [Cryobacterium psychrotolerans]
MRSSDTGGAEATVSPRHQQLIVTIYGLYAREEGVSLPVAALVRLMGDLGVEAAGVRSSVSRLKRRGVLESRRNDGVATYAISAGSVQMFAEGDTRIFAPVRATIEDKWLLAVFSIPESIRAKRHVLRSELTRLGYGSVTPGVWIAPAKSWKQTRVQLRRLGLEQYVDFFSADHLGAGELYTKVAAWWDLDALDRMYADFVERYDGLLSRWQTRLAQSAAAGTDNTANAANMKDAFTDYVPMFTEWRRLPYLDPGLPLEYLPADWNGVSAEALFGSLHSLLGPLAHGYVAGTIHQK